jgi:chromosome segregation ATPase
VKTTFCDSLVDNGLQSMHLKELSSKNSQISALENSLNNTTRDKNAFFDQLQLRQAELESAHTHLESLQHQNTEFQFQLRESNDRLVLLREEYAELQREQEATARQRDPVTPAGDVAHLISAVEAKCEVKISELKRNLITLEKERNEAEGDWSRKLREKGKELDELKGVLGSATKTREADEGVASELRAEVSHAKEVARVLRQQVSELPLLQDQVSELKVSCLIC